MCFDIDLQMCVSYISAYIYINLCLKLLSILLHWRQRGRLCFSPFLLPISEGMNLFRKLLFLLIYSMSKASILFHGPNCLTGIEWTLLVFITHNFFLFFLHLYYFIRFVTAYSAFPVIYLSFLFFHFFPFSAQLVWILCFCFYVLVLFLLLYVFSICLRYASYHSLLCLFICRWQ